MSMLRVSAFSEAEPKDAFVEAFCDAAQRLRKDPYRVGLSSPQADALFLTLPLPVPREFWLVERDGVVVGRIGAAISGTDSTRGAVGFFEVEPGDAETATELLSRAEAWLRARGALSAYGPVNINTWFPYRFRVGGTNDKQYSWEPVNPPSYPAYFESAGFAQDQLYHSELMKDLNGIVHGFEQGYRKTLEAGYTYRTVETGAGLDDEIGILYRLSVAGFKDNYLFDPIPEAIFRMLYVAQARQRQSMGCFFVAHPDHGEVGFSICFVDEAHQFVCKSLVVLPEHQGHSLSLGLLHKSFGAALMVGHRSGVGALLQSGNRSEAASRRSPLGWQHQYALYRKSL